MMEKAHRCGFTLVEAVLAVTIIALLAAFIVPAVNLATRSRENGQAARKLQTAVEALELYASERGDYPADVNRGIIPPEMAEYYFPYYKIDWWDDVTELGGQWDWGHNQLGATATVAIVAPTRSTGQMTEFDRLIDDGNLNTGKFRYDGDKHYYYIIQE
ncbi:MAG: type II secretion system protein [Kiritimatiellales bacterium]|jgi:prepilin-type N-terminal cleavage/methylation domain-containing protein